MTKETSVVEQWCHDVIYGVGGFHDFETYELFVPADRDVALVEFALRALAHDVAPTSKEVLESIAQHRDKMSTPMVATPTTAAAQRAAGQTELPLEETE